MLDSSPQCCFRTCDNLSDISAPAAPAQMLDSTAAKKIKKIPDSVIGKQVSK